MKAGLNINTLVRNGITCLGETFVTSPFKLMNITENKKGKQLHLMLMSSSPGILDEDEYNIKICVGENGTLQLHTQSYQRIFNMKKGAEQHIEVILEKGTSFIYLPHPSVPHEKSIYKAINKIYLQESSTLIWAEILTCGRKLNGEIFQYSKYQSITDIYYNEKLIIKENLFMQPSLINPASTGQMEGFTHQGSMIIFTGEGIGDRRQKTGDKMTIKQINNITVEQKEYRAGIKENIYAYLSTVKEISFGISSTPSDGIIIRISGYKAEQLYDIFKYLAGFVK